jgi:hypothetical protein
MIESEKMSKTFTIDRRKEARQDFDSRMEFNLEKRKVKKKQLEKKFYNYNFKPKINKNRINIYSSKAPKVVVKKNKKTANKYNNVTAPPQNAFKKKTVKRKSNLGRDTHMKKITKSKEHLEDNFSNIVSARTKPKESTRISNLIGANIESIKYDYSITNNNSFESIHQRLKGSEFCFETKEENELPGNPEAPTQDNQNFQFRQPEIKFSGFSKSQTRLNQKQNLKKSNTEAPAKSKKESEVHNQSLQNYEHNPLDDAEEILDQFEPEFEKKMEEKVDAPGVKNVSQSRNGLNLFLNNENGKFMSNSLDIQVNETESEGFFKLSANEKINSMKVNIKGHFSNS